MRGLGFGRGCGVLRCGSLARRMSQRERAACFLGGPPAIAFEAARAGASSWRAHEAAAVGPLSLRFHAVARAKIKSPAARAAGPSSMPEMESICCPA